MEIARIAAGMSTREKQTARICTAMAATAYVAQWEDMDEPDEALPVCELFARLGLVVTHFDEASGDAASRLVVR